MKFKLLALLILLSILQACSAPTLINKDVAIDWVDFICLNNIHYMGNYQGGNKLTNDKINEVIGEVKFNVSENVQDHYYKVKNGDSAFVPEGTKLYRIQGYNPDFRIAVKAEGEWRIYEADTNTKAKKGEELIDIRDKVLYIGINSKTDGKTELGFIKDKAIIEKMVNMVLNAEVDQGADTHGDERFFISFHLSDGSDVTRSYWIDSGELSRGILLPKEFGIEVSKALSDFESTKPTN